jgi:hypothetical protein
VVFPEVATLFLHILHSADLADTFVKYSHKGLGIFQKLVETWTCNILNIQRQIESNGTDFVK